MKKFEVLKNVVNALTGISAIAAGLACMIHLGLWWLLVPFLGILAFLYYFAAAAFHFMRAAKSLKSYKTFLLLVTFIFDSLYLLWFFKSYNGVSYNINNIETSKDFLDLFSTILFTIYAVMIILSMTLELLFILESKRDIKEEKNKYTLFVKIIDYAAIGSMIFTGVVNTYYYGYATLNYILLIFLLALIATILLNSFSKYRKSRLEFTVGIFILYIIYLAGFLLVYFYIIFDDLPKSSETLLLASWISTAVLIPIVITFNIVYLVKTQEIKKETVETVS